jgi:hypothetical protein
MASPTQPQRRGEQHRPRWLRVACLLLLFGCGRATRPRLGIVEGVVTLDGKPLADATVRFTPHGPGRTAQGVTDASGHYALLYLRDIPGADVDRHVVRITTAREEAGGVESLPPRYHRRSQLEAHVEPGRNRHDFPLESAGP